MNALTTFLKLPGPDKKLLIKTLLLMFKIRVMVWILPFSRIQNTLPQVSPIKKNTSLNKLVWAVKVTSHYLPRTTCLTNALTGHSLLSQHGYPSMVKIGVGRSAKGEFEAHAWLEHKGEVVIGRSEKEYIPLLDIQQNHCSK